MRIAYVTALFPYEHGEGFLIEEVRALATQLRVFVVPVRLETKSPYHPVFGATVLALPLLSMSILALSIQEFLRHPFVVIREICQMLASDTRSKIVLKNLAVIPKALWLAARVRELGIEHIHAHWAGTTATMAWLAASIARVRWSFTAHRWDIDEANALGAKLRSARFARAISRRGLQQLREAEPRARLLFIPMGVVVPPTVREPNSSRSIRLLVPANLFEVKGHRYLLYALAQMKASGTVSSCDFAGTGPQLRALIELVADLQLADIVRFLGALPHSTIIRRYEEATVDLVVLPSIITATGEQEGVPVALMEAMAFGLPVISTQTGAIAELIEDAGILVPPKDSEALKDAITRVADPGLRRDLGERARKRVRDLYDVSRTATHLAAAVLED